MSEVKLPQGWVLSAIGNVCELNPKDKLEDELEVGFMPMAGVPTNYLGHCKFEKKTWIQVKKGFTQFKNGDAIFAKITPCFENSKAAVINGFPNNYGAGSTEYYVLRPNNSVVDAHWLFALVKTKEFLTIGAMNMSGSVGHKRVPKDFVLRYPLPLPPLIEQSIIIEKLDTLLAQVDSIKAHLEKIPLIIKQFRRAMLSSVINSKLSNTSIIKKVKISDITNIISGIAFKKNQYSESGSKLLQIANISYGETCWNNTSYIPFNLADDYSRCDLETNDIVLALNRPITNNSLKVALINDADLPATLYQRVARIRVPSKFIDIIYPKFLFIIMLSDEFRKEVERNLQGSDQPYLNTSQLYNFEIQYPPLEEQAEIVRRVGQLFAYADGVEKQVQSALEQVNNLTQSILAKAFRGELTAQWREENPELISGENSAEALLARIKAERAAQQQQKKTRQKANAAG
ncbi:restriction endonuclease subunit S [Dickeya chrysanthemi]|uniref:restriction endonuclease subunit S n=1 Tax=Dickeya chrysanthemi TaxID=556 RepID=UPI003016DF28